MKKLISWLKWVDDNLLHFTLIAFILAVSLLPKFPLQHVEYTYIKIRFDDLLPVIFGAVFLIQLIRKKVSFNSKFFILVVFFWTAVVASFLVGFYLQNTIPVANLGLLHSLRRIQYMVIFFFASSIVTSEKRFSQYMHWYFIALLLVGLYGLGQKFLQFPSIQSMNPAYVDGRLLILNPEDRINSTFGGHFDLAAYMTFSIPVLFGFYFAKGKKYFLGLFIISLMILLYTAARSSFVAYLATTTAFLLYRRKFRFYFITLLITAGLLLVTGDMTKRLLQTFQVKTVFVNQQTGQKDISQKITTENLPAGNLQIPFYKGKKQKVDESQIQKVALEQAIEEAQRKGKKLNSLEVKKRADEISKHIQAEKLLLCDIACAARLQQEWPRALGAFLFNPIFGTGPSSLGEATDNDFLRWLGEFGLVGTILFLYLLYSICKLAWRKAKETKNNNSFIYQGFVFGVLALLLNGLYIDVFEASKVAYNFWLVAGLYVGLISIHEKRNKKT